MQRPKAYAFMRYAIGTDLTCEQEVGKVTSGALSPILKHNISMGYIKKPYNKVTITLFERHTIIAVSASTSRFCRKQQLIYGAAVRHTEQRICCT
jgi:glycine cleavage system aminomethyltransferase T